MIYLIESAGYKEEGGIATFFKLLKIGYTEDFKKDKRFITYKLHNPTCKVLYEILGYDEDIEKRIQYKFKNLIYSDYGREWFNYSEDIINFFKDIDKIDLYSLPKNPNREDKVFKNKLKEVKGILSYVLDLSEINDYLSKLVDIYGDKLCSEIVIKHLKDDNRDLSNYEELIKCKELGIYSENDDINKEVIEFMSKFSSLTTIYDKLKMLCEFPMSDTTREIILRQIPDSDEVKFYYTNLNPVRLKALSYNTHKIKKELGIVKFSYDLLKDSIYSEFNVGDKLLLSDIKLRLSNIYSSINYTATPKAKDLEKFFNIKDSTMRTIVNGEKKIVKYYELLSKK